MAVVATLDPNAPQVAATPANPQRAIMARAAVHSPFLCVHLHGSNGDSESAFESGNDNNPNYPTAKTFSNRDLTLGLVARGIPIWSPDLFAVDPVTNLYEPNVFGNKDVMATVNRGLTEVAPAQGLRTDMIGLWGGSQGCTAAMQYLLQWPQRVAYALWVLPGSGDIEAPRIGSQANPGRYQVAINRGWFGAGHDYDVPTYAYAPGGPPGTLLVSAGAGGTSFVANNLVSDPAGADNGFGCVLWRCTSPTGVFDKNPAHWQPLDPMDLHFLTTTEGGKSLTWPLSSPLANLAACALEPANVRRLAQIIDGTLPILNGRKVPVFCYYSTGDVVSMGRGSNGVINAGPWLWGKIGLVPQLISTEVNHGGQTENLQPLDPKWKLTKTLTSNSATNAASWVATPTGSNAQTVIHVDETLWSGGSFVFESSADGASWSAVNGETTTQYLASVDATEGPAIAGASAPGWYRVKSGAKQIRIRKTAGGNMTVTLGPAYPDGAEMALLAYTWVDDIARKILRVA